VIDTLASDLRYALRREQYAGYRIVAGDFLNALGVTLRRGRLLTPQDRAGAPPVTVVNQALARQLFPDQDPIGQRVTFGSPDSAEWRQIVGVGQRAQSLPAVSRADFRDYLRRSRSFAGFAAGTGAEEIDLRGNLTGEGAPKGTISELFSPISWQACLRLISLLDEPVA